MSDSRSRAAETEEAREDWATENPSLFHLGQTINRTRPWTGEHVQVTGIKVSDFVRTFRWTVRVNGGQVWHDQGDFQPAGQPFSPSDRAALDELAEVERAQEARIAARNRQLAAFTQKAKVCTDFAASAQNPEQANEITRLKMRLDIRDRRIERLEENAIVQGALDEDDEDDEGLEPSDVVEPNHYNVEGAGHCWDIIESLGMGFHDGNAMKYLYRAGLKTPDPRKDVMKAIQSLTRHLANLEAQHADEPETEALSCEYCHFEGCPSCEE